jgi:hypothetical protein
VYIDVGAEGGFFRLPNANVPNGAWDAARAAIGEGDTTTPGDRWTLAPGFAADNQDMIAIYWDRSASELSRKLYDDSANTWSETSIATSITYPAPTVGYPHHALTVDLTNSLIILISWTNVDTLNADLLCWTVTEGAITAKTDVVTNSTDDQAYAAISIAPDGVWRAYYCGKTDGSETYTTSLRVYTKVSKDAGSTWGPETALSDLSERRMLFTTPRPYLYSETYAGVRIATKNEFYFGLNVPTPSARHQMYGG